MKLVDKESSTKSRSSPRQAIITPERRNTSKADQKAAIQNRREICSPLAISSISGELSKLRIQVLESFHVGKSAQQDGSQELQMTNRCQKFFEPSLAVGYLCIEEILIVAPIFFAIQVLIGPCSDRNRCSGQYVADPAAQT